ncbi:hypothetical protein PGB90_009125 [Kerria lacca]
MILIQMEEMFAVEYHDARHLLLQLPRKCTTKFPSDVPWAFPEKKSPGRRNSRSYRASAGEIPVSQFAEARIDSKIIGRCDT